MSGAPSFKNAKRHQTASAMRRMGDPTSINVVLGLLQGNKRP
jgi:hypothetical protein